MKIIGYIYTENGPEMVLKGDSCLLNGRKPFFLPEGSSEIGCTPCLILRVSRLGKSIAPAFAGRYYDAVAHGADFIALDLAREAQAAGRPWTQALAFDYSLAIGPWQEIQKVKMPGNLLLSPEEAISEASKVMTVRQGDLIYIQAARAPQRVQKEDIIRFEQDGEELVYCKIK